MDANKSSTRNHPEDALSPNKLISSIVRKDLASKLKCQMPNNIKRTNTQMNTPLKYEKAPKLYEFNSLKRSYTRER